MVGFLRPIGSIWNRTSTTIVLLGVFQLIPETLNAAPIRNGVKLDRQSGPSWAAYLLAKPAVWRSQQAPDFTPAVRARIWRMLRTNDPTAFPIINYLIWRRNLRPNRFDFYHPLLGPTLANLTNQPVRPTVPQNIVPPTTPPVSPSVPQTIEPNVPEPSSLLIALIMGFWGLWSRKRLRLAQTST